MKGPIDRGGYPVWTDERAGVHIRFVGKGPPGERADVLARIGEGERPVAWAQQIHSATVLAAAAGLCGEGDALWSAAPDLALSVVTADCVPVLLAGPAGHVAAVHAGWRGIVAGVLPATLGVLCDRTDAGGWTAWIGPAIGACCYEVGEEVARQVVAASGAEALPTYLAGRPHLDLQAAAKRQLRAAGVEDIRTLAVCTRCAPGEPALLSSYRREGKGAGRNLGYIWRRR